MTGQQNTIIHSRGTSVFKTLFWCRSKLRWLFPKCKFGRIEHWLYTHSFPPHSEGTVKSAFWFQDWRDSWFFLDPTEFIDASIILTGTYEPNLQRFLEKNVKPGSLCLDVGANIGVMSLCLARCVGESGTVHAFEPHPECFSRLQKNIGKNHLENRIFSHQLALGKAAGIQALFTFDHQWKNRGMSSLVNQEHPALHQKIDVTVSTLDSFWESIDCKRIDFIKVDIQGAELAFLQGGIKALKAGSMKIIIELSPSDLKAAGTNSKEVLTFLSDQGYEFFNISGSGDLGPSIDLANISPQFNSPGLFCMKSQAA